MQTIRQGGYTEEHYVKLSDITDARPYQISVRYTDSGDTPLTLADLKNLLLGLSIQIEVAGAAIDIPVRELANAEADISGTRHIRVQVRRGEETKATTLQVE